MTKRILIASATLALVLCAGTFAYAMDEQSIAVPVPGAPASAPQVGVQSTAPAIKAESGTEIRIPGLGKLGTLPKMDFGLELLYGAAEAKSVPDPLPDDNQDLMIRGSVKHNF